MRVVVHVVLGLVVELGVGWYAPWGYVDGFWWGLRKCERYVLMILSKPQVLLRALHVRAWDASEAYQETGGKLCRISRVFKRFNAAWV